ncbi:MAG: peptidylprolyl isomerase [Pseudomonadota bacterium]
MKKLLTISAAIFVLGSASYAQDASTVVAKVGDTEITLGHVAALIQRLPEQYDAVPSEDLFTGVLDQFIQQEMLRADSDLSDEELQIFLQNEQRTAHAENALDRIAAMAITNEKVLAAYDARVEGIEPIPQYRASHILLETEEAANEVLALAQKEDADFAALAREHSTGPSGPNGGDLDWFGKGAMVPEFDAAVQDMEVGEVRGLVQTQFGFHIIKLDDARDYVPSLDELRAEIEENLRTSAIEARIGQLENDADVQRMDVDFNLDAIRDPALFGK